MAISAPWFARLSPRRRRVMAMIARHHDQPRPAEETPSARLRRLGEWCVDGRLAAAEIELFEWQRRGGCPTAARALLAALLARRGEVQLALHVLHAGLHLQSREDAFALQIRIASLVTADLLDTTRRITRQMQLDLGHDAAVAMWLRFMHVPGTETIQPANDSAVEQLAAELMNRFELIPSLVAAQRAQPCDADVKLLRGAIARLANNEHDKDQSLVVCHALASLAMIAHDAEDARRWAHRGLKLNPYAAQLALILSDLDDDLAAGPRAASVLQDASAANPHYADLRRALILRHQRDGDLDAARMQIHRWLDREPAHPVANQLCKELAA